MNSIDTRDTDPATAAGQAPVIVFAYARPDHLRRMVSSLKANAEAPLTDLVIFCDAAKRPEHEEQVAAVRTFVESIDGFRSVQRVYRKTNAGLAQSVIDGVNQVLRSHGRAIVVEDDLLLSPHFLKFMNDGLSRYASDERVASIHGYVFPIDEPLPETFFLQGADCWGWATWERAWRHFDNDGPRLLAELRSRDLSRHFDLDGQYPYTSMLQDQIAGRNHSWAILWHASCYLEGLLTLYPGRSLVENIGNDSSGTHCETTDALSRHPTEKPVQVGAIAIEPSPTARAAIVRFFAARRTWTTKLRGSVKRVLGRVA